jgi:hypothetical protein
VDVEVGFTLLKASLLTCQRLHFSGCKIRHFIEGNNTILEIFLQNIAVKEKIRIFAAAFDAINHTW